MRAQEGARLGDEGKADRGVSPTLSDGSGERLRATQPFVPALTPHVGLSDPVAESHRNAGARALVDDLLSLLRERETGADSVAELHPFGRPVGRGNGQHVGAIQRHKSAVVRYQLFGT